MIKEAIESIVKLAPASQKARIEQAPFDPRKWILDKGDSTKILDAAPPLREHVVATLGDLIEFAKRDTSIKPVFWHHPNRVWLVLDDDDRRELVKFPLDFSRPFGALAELAESDDPTFTPKTLANFLKVKLAGCEVPTELITALRRLKWSTTSNTTQVSEHGRESIGKDVEAMLTANVELPEQIVIQTPVYRDVGEERQYALNCLIDPRPFDQKIALIPLPGEIDDAINLHQADIRRRIVEALPDVPVFAGTP